MHRSFHWLILAVLSLSVAVKVVAENPSSAADTTCNFNADTQLAVEYQRVEIEHGKKSSGSSVFYGKVWAPGGKPLTLFTNTPIVIGGKKIPDGAYTLFLIPEENKSWTLIVSKSTDTSGKYDEAKDLVRVPMDFGKLPGAEAEFTAYFAHVAPNQCNLRLALGKARAWTIFERE